MKIIIILYSLCALIFSTYASVFNSSLLNSKQVTENHLKGGLVKYLVYIQSRHIRFCSGCMISERHVLTAAQCIVNMEISDDYDFSMFTVVIGKNEHQIARVNYHPCYRPKYASRSSHYNVGLILIRERIFGSKEVGWTKYSKELTAVGTEAVLVGWFSEEKCNNKSVPGTIGVIIVNFEICLRVLRNFNLYKNKQLCGLAKNLNQKAIPENAGSPLFDFNNQVIGIYSYLLGREEISPTLFSSSSSWELYINSAIALMHRDDYTSKNFTAKQRSCLDSS